MHAPSCVLVSNNKVKKFVKVEKCNPKSYEEFDIVWNDEYCLSTWSMQNVLVKVINPLLFRANPIDKPPINAFQMKILARKDKLECQLCLKIYHHSYSWFKERLLINSHPNGPKHPKPCSSKRMRHHLKSFQIIKKLSNIGQEFCVKRVSLILCTNAFVNDQV